MSFWKEELKVNRFDTFQLVSTKEVGLWVDFELCKNHWNTSTLYIMHNNNMQEKQLDFSKLCTFDNYKEVWKKYGYPSNLSDVLQQDFRRIKGTLLVLPIVASAHFLSIWANFLKKHWTKRLRNISWRGTVFRLVFYYRMPMITTLFLT